LDDLCGETLEAIDIERHCSCMEQDIRFRTAGDGARMAYSTMGTGPALVFVPRWVSHLELNWQSRRELLTPLAEHFRLVRYDKRGTGLSDRAIEDFSIDSQLRDLTALIEELGLERFSLYASSAGGPVAVSYAARYPERVDNLVLYGTFARLEGITGRRQTSEALLSLMRAEWGLASTALTEVFMPGASSEEREGFAFTQRLSADSEVAARFWEAFLLADVRALLPRVQAPTLVVHSKGDRAVPLHCGWELSAGIRDARFVSLESDRHILSPELERQHWATVLDFLLEKSGRAKDPATPLPAAKPVHPDGLSDREVEVLKLIAEGKTNQQIAGQLYISLNTVAHHVANIFAKAGLANRAQAASYAHRHHLI
jgi:pimeloyl-ACP methyl ester carboxylesterase/DNA-binding CsgD family transcriptional regulator